MKSKLTMRLILSPLYGSKWDSVCDCYVWQQWDMKGGPQKAPLGMLWMSLLLLYMESKRLLSDPYMFTSSNNSLTALISSMCQGRPLPATCRSYFLTVYRRQERRADDGAILEKLYYWLCNSKDTVSTSRVVYEYILIYYIRSKRVEWV